MTFTEFCHTHHVTTWAAHRLGPDRWRIIVQWTDGSRHQMTLTVHSRTRPEAPAILRKMVQEARTQEAAPTFPAWCTANGLSQEEPAALHQWRQAEKAQRQLMRFLGWELYQKALRCTD